MNPWIFLGRYFTNYERLRLHRGPISEHFEYVSAPPTSQLVMCKVNNATAPCVLGYMDWPGEHQGELLRQVLVSVNDRVLARPLVLQHGRHLDEGEIGPRGKNIDDDQLRTILLDVIASN